MWKALAIKELRDLSLIVAASAFAFFVWTATIVAPRIPWIGTRREIVIPFLTGEILGPLIMISGATAIGIGLRQSTCVLNESSSQFLMHRPIERWRLIAFKLCIGFAVVCVLTTTAVILICLRAAIPGNIPAPFQVWMTTPAWIAIACVSVVYHSAFLSGLRPARWFGSRLLPTIGTLPIAFGVGLLSYWSLIPGLMAVICLNWVLWIVVRNIADSRDYA